MNDGAVKDSYSAADIMRYFGMKIGDFRREWAQLTTEDKSQIKSGLNDGTYTY